MADAKNATTTLKPCPFCGGEARYVELYTNRETGESSGYICCAKIIPCVAQPNVRSKEYVYKKWNRRADNEKDMEAH